SEEKIEINPNSIELVPFVEMTDNEKREIKIKYGIPNDKKTFIYGGNLGKPQGIDFLIETLKAKSDDERAFFVVIGSGTEYNKIRNWFDTFRP
ncbi:glycosyltransferase, partial [Brevibacillus sp. SIMBA_040]